MRESAVPRVEDASVAERAPEPESGPEANARPSPAGFASSFFVGAAMLLAIGGIAYRIWLALGPLGRAPNSDEAVVGLMALHLWRDHETRAFFWRLPYGGALQTWLMAPIVGLFGTSTFTLRAVTVIEGIVTPIVTWRIARHFFKPRVALLAGVIALWWPLALVYFSTQERQFYALGALLGLSAVLMAVNIDEKPAQLRHWFALGLLTGVGWWTSPNVIYYTIPIVVYLLVRGHWRQWRGITIAAATFLIGSSVWTYANLHSGFMSLRSPDWAGNSTYSSRLGFFFETGLPFTLGLRHPWTTHWFGNASAGRILYGVGIVILGVALVLAVRRIRSSASIIVLLVVIAPFIYAWFPPTWALNEGRYLYFFASLLPLLVCEVLQFPVGRVVVLGFVTITAVAFIQSYGTKPQGPTVTGIARALEANGYHTAVGSYWTSYILTYMSGEHVITSPMPGQPGARYAPYIREIQHSNPAYVFGVTHEGISDGGFRRALRREKIKYRVVVSGAYAAVLPARPIPAAP
jgi:hypothetical protein